MSEIIEKVCSECEIKKPVSMFYRDYFISTKLGYVSKCKDCFKKYQENRVPFDKDLSLKTQICNKCLIEKDISEFYKSTRHKTGYNLKCKKCHIETQKNKGNNTKIKRQGEYLKQVQFKKYKTPHNKMKYAIRKSLSDRLSNKIKSSVSYLGASINFFKLWMEFQFNEHMNWENHGSYWHIDHLNPWKIFNFEIDNEINLCWNWSNLRPLERFENILKSDFIDNDIISKQQLVSKQFLDNYSDIIKLENDFYDLTAS